MVKACESIGRHAKPVVRPRKFVAHKKTHGFIKEMSIRCDSSMTYLSRIDIVVCDGRWESIRTRDDM